MSAVKKFAAVVLFFCLADLPLFADKREDLTNSLGDAIDWDDVGKVRLRLKSGADSNGIYDRSDGETFLMYSVRLGNLKIAELLLEYGADTNARDKKGRTAVYYARNQEKLKLLTDHKARLDVFDNKGISPLMDYASNGRTELVDFALAWEKEHSPAFSAGFENRKDYYSDLLIRFKYEDTEWALAFAQHLLDGGADPNARNSEGQNTCFQSNGIEMLELLVSHGMRFDIYDNDGKSPLMKHIQRNPFMANFALSWEQKHSPGFSDYTALLTLLVNPDITFNQRGQEYALNFAKRLFDLGADAAARNEKGIPIINLTGFYIIPLLIEHGAPVDEANQQGTTNLMRAAYADDGTLVDFLLLHGANPNKQDRDGKTPLMMTKSETITVSLLKRGADPNLQDKDGKTALMHNYRYPKILETLILAGIDPNLKDKDGETILLKTNSYPDIQKLLLLHGADPTIKYKRGATVLHYWYEKGDMELLDEFLSLGCQIDEPDNKGLTPLWYAAYASQEYEKPILALIEKGADPNAQNDKGESVLLRYLKSTKSDGTKDYVKNVVAALLAAGARPADTDDEGNSALSYAVKSYPAGNRVRKMIVEHVNTDEKKAAEAIAKQNRKEHRHDILSDQIPSTIGALSLPFIVGGLSILMREAVFKGDPSNNFMGTANGVMTLGTGGFFAGVLTIGVGLASSSTYRGDMAIGAGLGEAIFGGGIGIIAGIIIACLPPVRTVFKENAALYYTPTALSALAAAIIIFNIWW